MIKLTQYINPVDSAVWCVTVEYTDENNKPVFTALYDIQDIAIALSDEYKEQLKEQTGQNIATVYISEEPDN